MEENVQNVKKYVTAVIYDKMTHPFFLILKRKLNWEGWEFVKGGVEEGETEEEAVKREIVEETGLQKFKIVRKLDGVFKKYLGPNDKLHVHSVYLVDASMNIPINIPKKESSEHSTYLWASYDSAMSKLTWGDDKEILKKALAEVK